ncbi:hypothetical protein Ct61P_02171 [Colletotrichum tofieldiae]|nr:hypothetical protein Ct61P_02171 [Colletotrichum tofieldiae]
MISPDNSWQLGKLPIVRSDVGEVCSGHDAGSCRLSLTPTQLKGPRLDGAYVGDPREEAGLAARPPWFHSVAVQSSASASVIPPLLFVEAGLSTGFSVSSLSPLSDVVLRTQRVPIPHIPSRDPKSQMMRGPSNGN